MWRAERLKAGVGSRSKAASPALVHPRLLPCCECVVSECCSIWVEGGVRSCLHGNPKTWCNRCRPACRALASCFSELTPPCPNLPSSSLSYVSLNVPVVPDRAWWDPDGLCSVWHTNALPACVPESLCVRSSWTPEAQHFPPPLCSLCSWFLGLLWGDIRLFAVFGLCVLAAWLLCNAEILPPSCSLDKACRSRLFHCLLLYITVCW